VLGILSLREGDRTQVAQRDGGVSILGIVLRVVLDNWLWVALLEQRRLDKLTSRGPFQPQPGCRFVKHRRYMVTNLQQNKAPPLPLLDVFCVCFFSQVDHYHLPFSFYSYLKAICSPYLNKTPEKTLFWTPSLQRSLYFGNGKAGISSKTFLRVRKEKKKLKF